MRQEDLKAEYTPIGVAVVFVYQMVSNIVIEARGLVHAGRAFATLVIFKLTPSLKITISELNSNPCLPAPVPLPSLLLRQIYSADYIDDRCLQLVCGPPGPTRRASLSGLARSCTAPLPPGSRGAPKTYAHAPTPAPPLQMGDLWRAGLLVFLVALLYAMHMGAAVSGEPPLGFGRGSTSRGGLGVRGFELKCAGASRSAPPPLSSAHARLLLSPLCAPKNKTLQHNIFYVAMPAILYSLASALRSWQCGRECSGLGDWRGGGFSMPFLIIMVLIIMVIIIMVLPCERCALSARKGGLSEPGAPSPAPPKPISPLGPRARAGPMLFCSLAAATASYAFEWAERQAYLHRTQLEESVGTLQQDLSMTVSTVTTLTRSLNDERRRLHEVRFRFFLLGSLFM